MMSADCARQDSRKGAANHEKVVRWLFCAIGQRSGNRCPPMLDDLEMAGAAMKGGVWAWPPASGTSALTLTEGKHRCPNWDAKRKKGSKRGQG
jgi:hypothetical protein